MTKVCGQCGLTKNLSEFPSCRTFCKACYSKKTAAYNKARRESGWKPDKKYFYWERYRLRPEDIADILTYQNNQCVICTTNISDKFCVDHDHSCCSGQYSCGDCVRGFLCHNCNILIGFLERNSQLLNNAFAYLKGEHHKPLEA